MALSANAGGWIADTLVSKGVSVTRVRKVLIIFHKQLLFIFPFAVLMSTFFNNKTYVLLGVLK